VLSKTLEHVDLNSPDGQEITLINVRERARWCVAPPTELAPQSSSASRCTAGAFGAYRPKIHNQNQSKRELVRAEARPKPMSALPEILSQSTRLPDV
jgi:hypothetical protein